jgi:streptomycin 6-kinase
VDQLNFYFEKWNLTHPIKVTETPTSLIYKVQFNSKDAVLKILTPLGKEDEADGASVLRCYNGKGAARLLDYDEGAHLLDFIDGQLLKSLVVDGNDQQATQIICQVVSKLHSYSGKLPPGLTSMQENFSALWSAAENEPRDSIYVSASKIASRLLDSEKKQTLLHGDLHHNNIMESTEHGWLAIDPKGVVGENTYDLANVFYNPDDLPELVETPNRINQLARDFSQFFKIDEKRDRPGILLPLTILMIS